MDSETARVGLWVALVIGFVGGAAFGIAFQKARQALIDVGLARGKLQGAFRVLGMTAGGFILWCLVLVVTAIIVANVR